MNVTFFDDPMEGPLPPEEVRMRQLGLYIYPDKRRVAVGFELTRFRERPSLEVTITNEEGKVVSSLNVIEVLSPNFSLTMHLRDSEPANSYHIAVTIYYATPETERQDVNTCNATFTVAEPGEQIFKFEE
ncbi:MAG: hypothetical protein H6658_02790 [Ardenticatenaceae bacterium]|nr:hypothetical protein [Ardenticatenaceae bacterium]